MKRWHKALILSLMGGDLYCMVELIWRGHTHWSMFLLAAVLSLPLDLANEHMAWERPLWLQALMGGGVITLAELGAGLRLERRGPAAIRAAVEQVLGQRERYRRAIAPLAAGFRAAGGAARAAEKIEETIARKTEEARP